MTTQIVRGSAPRRSGRPRLVDLWWTTRDYAKRVWDNSGEDNIFFLAGGIAFNILLAAVPFFLLIFSGIGYLLNLSERQSSAQLFQIIDRLLPPHAETAGAGVHRLINDIIKTRGSVGLFGLIGFVWFSTRLFGSLRTVLAEVFDIEQERGIIEGKIFDVEITLVATLLFAASAALSAYLTVATTRGVELLASLGLRHRTMGTMEYWIGRAIATFFSLAMFFALYKFLPKRRIRWRAALVGAVFTGVLFEVAKAIFAVYLRSFNPGGLYTGTLSVIVIIVFWVYYAALIFILGGEVGQVYQLRRVRRAQREVFD